MAIPPTAKFREPVLEALRAKNGEASNAEILAAVAAALSLTDEDLAQLHNEKKGKRTEVEYRLAWARTKLKNAGLIERVRPQVWRLTASERPGHN